MKDAYTLVEHRGDDGRNWPGRIVLDLSDQRFGELEKQGLVREATGDEAANERGGDKSVRMDLHFSPGELDGVIAQLRAEFEGVIAGLEADKTAIAAERDEQIRALDALREQFDDHCATTADEKLALTVERDGLAEKLAALEAASSAAAQTGGEGAPGEGGAKEAPAPKNKKAPDPANKSSEG